MPHSETLDLRIARRQVKGYRDESDELMKRHHEAMECRECESFLLLGIEAYQWLIRADQTIRKAVYAGAFEWDDEMDGILEQLFRGWFEPCNFALQWIRVQEARGFSVENKDVFLTCCEEVKAILASFDETELPEVMAEVRDDAVTEYHDGETAAFV